MELPEAIKSWINSLDETEKAEQRIEYLEAEAQRLRKQVREARKSGPDDPLSKEET